MTRTPRILALHTGSAYQLAGLERPPFDRFFDRLVHARDLRPDDLDDVDTLVVTCRTNAARLVPHRAAIARFLADGRTVVAMGETNPEAWLPVPVESAPARVNYWWWLTPGASLGLAVAAPGHPLFGHLTLADCTWHYHGTFAVPPGATVLLTEREGRAILYEDRVSTPGRLIVTSLDPFYHHGCNFMPATTRFLAGFLPWLREET